ncbi:MULTISPECIES: FitA-like ribbon-helix-helix domain-containing protein [unclassified Sphingomonas]|uniref:FitA-like ribbon-helix-helix domain-containing protein n=1 Tax=unclassified Sphingomonas TaxID=196159 RepID=UPI0008330226|nr:MULTISPECIES: hypothetical protein [unclassified Sphingomonas]
MATLTIRKLDDEVYERLRLKARQNHRSIEAEARHLLGERLGDRDVVLDGVDALRRRMAEKYGGFSDSVALIRQVRDTE